MYLNIFYWTVTSCELLFNKLSYIFTLRLKIMKKSSISVQNIVDMRKISFSFKSQIFKAALVDRHHRISLKPATYCYDVSSRSLTNNWSYYVQWTNVVRSFFLTSSNQHILYLGSMQYLTSSSGDNENVLNAIE